MRKFLAISAIALSTMILPSAANALCLISGTPVRVDLQDTSVAPNHIIYFKVGVDDSFYYRVNTSVDGLAAAAAAAVPGQTEIRVEGSAASCPVSGTSRFVGTLRRLTINP